MVSAICAPEGIMVLPAGIRESKGYIMKKDIHPEYGEATITCACGNVIHTRSTVREMHVNTCSRCHPFFTGQAKLLDAEGRVERFQRRWAKKSGGTKKS
jgi:large subunit ribosomal protein L31